MGRVRVGWKATLVAGPIILALAAFALAPAYRSHLRRRRIEAAIETARAPRAPAAAIEALVAYEEADAILELIAQLRSHDDATPLRHAIELHAAQGEGRDPLPAAALEELARDARLPLEKRFLARYCLAELASPTFPAEPPGFARRAWIAVRLPVATLDELTLAVAPSTTFAIDAGALRGATLSFDADDRPWRVLVRVAQQLGPWARLAVDGTTVRFFRRGGRICRVADQLPTAAKAVAHLSYVLGKTVTPAGVELVVVPPRWPEDMDHEKALAALAAMNGGRLAEKSEKEVAIVPR